MTAAEYLAGFLREHGITKVFAIQGGGSARLIDAIGSAEGIEYICNQHEQASAMSADGYARATGGIGCALSTSGPGATNLLTGVCGAFFDSIPILFITGQVSSFRLKGNIKVRCMHTQETDVVDIFRSVTKYAVALTDPYDIRYELEKCLYLAAEGRPGPVVIDIPDNYQREELGDAVLKSFYDSEEYKRIEKRKNQGLIYKKLVDFIKEAERPVIIAGWGIHCSKAEDEFRKIIEKLNIPIVCTWAANDILPERHYLKVGTLGMNGSVAGNVAVQMADLLIIVGARMDQHTIIVPLKDFGTKAKKVYVDIDQEEIKKFENCGSRLDLIVQEDIKEFLQQTTRYIPDGKKFEFADWLGDLMNKKRKAYDRLEDFHAEDTIVNPYKFFHTLSDCVEEDALIFIDTGSSLVWAEQSFRIKKGQRLHSSLNNTPMGYALPGAIGAAIATGGRIYSINGDGGLQMNLQELATVIRHNLDIKIILFDNSGYGMVQRTQDTYMGSRYEGTDVASGLAFPAFEELFKVYGFDVTVIDSDDDCKTKLIDSFRHEGPGCIIVKVSLNENYKIFYEKDVKK